MNPLQVKFIVSDDEFFLEKEINDFIKEEPRDVIDIKLEYFIEDIGGSYVAMIMFRNQ